MNTNHLSARLAAVAKFVPKGARLADIGSDHAYLPCFLAKNDQIAFAVAGEVARGPWQSAEKNVSAEGLADIISVRMGDGLEVIQPGEVDCITIAGMGGSLITSILEKGAEKLGPVKRLILQPNISAISIRKWLLDNGWELVAEEILEEDGKIYEVLAAEKGDVRKPYSVNLKAELLLGPFLIQRQEMPFKRKWKGEMENWRRIIRQLDQAALSEEAIEKKQELIRKIQLVEGALKNEDS